MIGPASIVILNALRVLMVQNGLNAYIVPAQDEHYTEFVAECHLRRPFISNFTGSSGDAIVTNNSALLWTDGRYYFQAEQELDLTLWTLMKDGMAGTPSQGAWLASNLPQNGVVGVDPALCTKGRWDALESELKAVGKNLTLKAVDANLVDIVWGPERPPCSNNPVFNLDMRFAGVNTSVKVQDVRKEMQDKGASVLLVTELDEVAWLLNLRGKDIPSSSTFFSFVIITQNTLDFFVNPIQINSTVRGILTQNVPELTFNDYPTAYAEFVAIIARNPTGMVWVNRNANYKFVRSVPLERLFVTLTPISLMKSLKNEVEVAGYRQALVRDSAVLCEFFAWLEDAMGRGEQVTETSAATVLYNMRQNRSELFFDKSFTTISATGINAAIIHYMPTEASSRPLNVSELYLCDSGALYFDGTTDITRTISFSTPTQFQREAYTRVLKGQINLATAKFPNKTPGHNLDSFAREFLWDVGLEYNHGTGHGIGAFLNIHEGPQGIGSGYRADDPGLQANMFTSNEPGYYDEERAFGIRLENVIRVQSENLTNDFNNRGWLGFEDMTWVPYEHKLINVSLLTPDEISYLNWYQAETRRIVGTYLQDNGFPQSAYDWMMRGTEPIGTEPTEPTPVTTTEEPTTTDSPNSGVKATFTFFSLIMTLVISQI